MHLRTTAGPARLAVMATWIAFLLLSAWPAFCQSATMGGLSGTVVNRDGAPIADTTVHLVQQATQQVQTTITAANGSYAFTLLPPGGYEVQFAARGFKTARMPDVVINVAEAPALDATLEPGQAAEPAACQCRITITAS